MLVQIQTGIYASGEPIELGSFAAAYVGFLSMFMKNVEKHEAEKDLIERLEKEFKSVKVTQTEKEDKKKDGSE